MAARGRTSGRTETRTEEDFLETERDLSQQDDDTDAGFTSLEDHLFGHRPFQHQGDLYEGEQTTMLHPASEQETLMQHDLHAPPPTQVVMELPPGSRVAPGLLTAPAPARPAPQLIAAGGVFAGMSFVMAGSLVALGLAASVLIALVLYPPRLWVPGTVAVPSSDGSASAEAASSDPALPPELVEGVRFPAMFAFNDWHAQEIDEVLLEELIAQLAVCRSIKLTGHTDPRGPDEVNDRIALARAGEVRRILVERGIDRRLIEVGSAGSAVPEIEETSREARALNRRVTVRCN